MTWWRRLTIRSRITIGSLVVAIAFSTVGLVAIRTQVASILHSADATLAVTDLASFTADIRANPSEPADVPSAGTLIFVRDPHGAVEADTMPHEIHELLEHRTGANETFAVTADGIPYTVVARTVHTPSGTWELWSARGDAAAAIALAGLDRVLFIGAAVLLAAFALASWLLASAALRPVARMRERAEGFGEAATSARLPVGAARDELAQLATTLNAFLDRVKESTDREKQMVSDASHELRTPLAALRTQLELAHGDFGDADALQRQVIAAERSVERLTSLATGLLALSRLEATGAAAGSSAAAASSSFDALVTEVMGSVDRGRMLAVESRADIAFDVDTTDPAARFPISPTDFGRLVDNLVANAVTAIGPSGTVRVSLAQNPSGLRLLVVDDGPGVPDSFLPLAFGRFTRPDDSRASSTGGSGLGLALVDAITRSAGGHARLRNEHPGLAAEIDLAKI